MSGLLPSPSEVKTPEGEPRVIGVDEEEAADLLSALSSETARSLLAEIHEEPGTPSNLADRTDTSLQNAQYHLEKLESADLIDVIDTRYSEKGREMNVYGAEDAPVVLFAGSREHGQDVRSALTSLIGGVGVVALGAVLVQELFGRGIGALFGAGGASGAAPVPGTTQEQTMAAQEVNMTTTVAKTVTERSYEIAAGAEQAPGLPPGALFFVGGVIALGVISVIWYARG
ncbi:MAG: ArsR/SmtB family transcription factor [Halodesulfurarchaeum sp.]